MSEGGRTPLVKGSFITVLQDVDDGVVSDIADYAPGAFDDMYLVDPHPLGSFKPNCRFEFVDVIPEDTPDSPLGNANILGYTREGPV